MTVLHRTVQALRVFAADVTSGFFAITHNGAAFLGVLVVISGIVLTTRPDLRDAGEGELRGWLHSRLSAAQQLLYEDNTDRAFAADPRELPRQQAAVTYWLAKKYRIAPEPLSVLVAESYDVGKRTKLDPTLILAIMAIESSFNPFAQSTVGAQGLMQVMTRVHTDKYENLGGELAAFNPVTNLRVGVTVLLDCIKRAGSVEGGLKYYVGAANLNSDGGYAAKVLAEHARLKQVAIGRQVPPEYSQAGSGDDSSDKLASLAR